MYMRCIQHAGETFRSSFGVSVSQNAGAEMETEAAAPEAQFL